MRGRVLTALFMFLALGAASTVWAVPGPIIDTTGGGGLLSATVTNVAEIAITAEITAIVDGTPIGSQVVTLAPGESEIVTFGNPPPGEVTFVAQLL